MDGKVKFLIILLTYDCNLRCSYCYEPKRKHKAMTIESAKAIVQKALDDVDDSYDSVEVHFMGGEPLLRFDVIRAVCECLWSTPQRIPVARISAPTNGTLVNDSMRGWLAENRDRFKLLLSFDGTRLMQNMNRSGSAARIDLDFFRDTYPDITVKMTMSPSTIGSLCDGVEYLYAKGFRGIEASLALGKELGWQKEHLRQLSKELERLVAFYAAHTDIKPFALLNIHVWRILYDNAEPLVCYCGRDILCYDCDGETYPCQIFSPITISEGEARKARTLDFDTIRRERNPACGRCMLKSVCTTCYGMNYIERGDCNSPSPFFCAQYKLFFFASCKLHKIRAAMRGDKEKEELIDKTVQLLIQSRKYENTGNTGAEYQLRKLG